MKAVTLDALATDRLHVICICLILLEPDKSQFKGI